MFYMPTINFDRVPVRAMSVMTELTENSKLITMPKWDCSFESKMIHNRLLKILFRDKRWTVPVHYSWGMPHLFKVPTFSEMDLADSIALEIFHSGCLVDHQPIQIDDKTYLCKDHKGVAFFLNVA